MLGWFSEEASRASRSSRARELGPEAEVSLSTLIATKRDSSVSRARYTCPMPPLPSSDTSSYGPRRVPESSVTQECANYSLRWRAATLASSLRRFAARLHRLLEQVLIEPLDVVLHRGPVTLRFRWPVADAAEPLIDDQLRRHLVVLKPLVQLVRVRQRHALVGGAVLDERRRLRLLDVG